MFKSYVHLLRPHHWIKNFIIFSPPVFAPVYISGFTWLNTIYVFFCFCICSSAVYVFNDLLDAKRDKLNTRTSSRPIANGSISKKSGVILSVILFILTIILTLILVPQSIGIIIFYILINIFYSIKLKFIIGLDVVVITLGFLSRIMAGGITASIDQSFWTLIIVGFASLSLALGKRLGQIQIGFEQLSAKWNRKLLLNLSILSIMFTIISYILFCFDPEVILRHENNYIWTTIPSIVLIFARYFQLCYRGKYSGDPTLILIRDPIIQIFACIWMANIFYLFVL